MGPGCFHPRNLALQVESTELLSLQWGRDVSIPEIRKRREPSARYQPLQWGRDVSIPEIPSGLPRGMVQRRASMGPGCFHPRNAAPVGSTHTSPWLQWGRDVSIPEMPYSFPAYTESTALQWGRDVSIPEMGSAVPQMPSSRRFNGAGMFPSQKWDGRGHAVAGDRASMGPGCFHPRNVIATMCAAVCIPSFNGAGMFPSQK